MNIRLNIIAHLGRFQWHLRLLIACFCGIMGVASSGPAYAQDAVRVVPENKMQAQLSFAPLVKRTTPAVVNIYTKRKVATLGGAISPLLNDPLLRQFFGEQLNSLGIPRERVVSSLGSGVIVRANGTIITNYHVIKESDQITVILADRREFEARIALADEKTDLAVLKIEAGEALPYLELGNSDTVQVGDLVLAIGNPFGVGQTVTSGIISAPARTTKGISDYQFFIQTDAAINPGNSGGALVGMDGALIGVPTAIYSRSGGSNGIGFAVPANMVRTVLAGQETQGRVVRPWLGIISQPITQEIADSLGLKRLSGVLVNRVYPGSPADAATLKTGDIILGVDGQEATDAQTLNYRIATYEPGKEATFAILRAGREHTIPVKLSAPPEKPARDVRKLAGQHPLSGTEVANLSPAVAVELGMDVMTTGVVVANVAAGSPAERIGVRRGDLILKVNRVDIGSTAELQSVMQNRQTGWRIALQRGREVLNLVITR